MLPQLQFRRNLIETGGTTTGIVPDTVRGGVVGTAGITGKDGLGRTFRVRHLLGVSISTQLVVKGGSSQSINRQIQRSIDRFVKESVVPYRVPPFRTLQKFVHTRRDKTRPNVGTGPSVPTPRVIVTPLCFGTQKENVGHFESQQHHQHHEGFVQTFRHPNEIVRAQHVIGRRNG